MLPFSRFSFRDRIQIQRQVSSIKGGANTLGYPNPPEALEPANVQTQKVTRSDPSTGRTTTTTVHNVRTPTNRHINTHDRIIWVDKSGQSRTLIAEGPSTPLGIGDVEYVAECMEYV